MNDHAVPATLATPLGEIAVQPRVCPACGAGNAGGAGNRYSRPPWSIRDCAACGFVYLDPAPAYEALDETISWDKARQVESDRRYRERPIGYRISRATRKRNRLPRRDIAHMIERHAPPGNVVDVGCADGGRIGRIAAAYVPFGIEIAADLAAKADRRLARRGGRCVHAPAIDAFREFPDGFFTGAILRSYLEHEVVPRDVLRELFRALAPGGVAVVKVPNYACLNRRVSGRKWCGFRFPDHVNYFTPASLRRMADAEGFVTEFGALGALPTSDNMWALLRRP